MIFDKIFEKRMTNEEMDKYTWNSISTVINSTDDSAMEESDYFKCIKILSESIGKVPCLIKQRTDKGNIVLKEHPLYNLLRFRPNNFMTATDFFKCCEARVAHNGYAGIYIGRDKQGTITGLYPVNLTNILIDNAGFAKTKMNNPILVSYTCGSNGQVYDGFYDDFIHFKGFTMNGFDTISIREKLLTTLATTKATKNYQQQLFEDGCMGKMVVQYTGDLTKPSEIQKVQSKFDTVYRAKTRVLPIPFGYNVSALNLNLADAEFSMLRKLSTVDLATSFGIPLYLMGYTEGYNNNSLEMAHLSFLNDTLSVIFKNMEEEMTYKLLSESERAKGMYIEFDVKQLYRLDRKTLTDILTAQVQNGILSPNECRDELGYEDVENGDELLMHSGMAVLSSVINPPQPQVKLTENSDNLDNQDGKGGEDNGNQTT